MKNILLALGVLSLSLLFSSCQDEDEVSPLSMVIEGTVLDAKTNKVISGLNIDIQTNNNSYSVVTDEAGYYQFEPLPSGEYVLRFSHADYLTKEQSVTSERTLSSDDTDHIVVNKNTEINPLSETVYMRIHKYHSEKHSRAGLAQNVTYTYRFGSGDEMSATTDENGIINLTKVPYNSSVYFTFDFESEGIKYKRTYSFYSGNRYSVDLNIPKHTENVRLGLLSSTLVTTDGSFVMDLPVNSDIAYHFNQAIDGGENLENITISMAGYAGTFTPTLTGNSDILTFVLSEDLLHDTFYHPRVTVKTMSGESQTFALSFRTAKAVVL